MHGWIRRLFVKEEEMVKKKNSPKSDVSNEVVKEKKVVPEDVDKITMSEGESNVIRVYDQNVLNYKLQLANVELQMLDIQSKKNELVGHIKTQSIGMMEQIRKIAENHGIDVEGVTDTRKWNLDTNDMTFYLTK